MLVKLSINWELLKVEALKTASIVAHLYDWLVQGGLEESIRVSRSVRPWPDCIFTPNLGFIDFTLQKIITWDAALRQPLSISMIDDMLLVTYSEDYGLSERFVACWCGTLWLVRRSCSFPFFLPPGRRQSRPLKALGVISEWLYLLRWTV